MPIKSERELVDINKVLQLRFNEPLHNALAAFCNCTKQELFRALVTRCSEVQHSLVYSETIHDVKERVTHFGYYLRSRPIKWKYRNLTTSNVDLQKVQDWIYQRLEVATVSLKSTWGKMGDSPEKHAEPHRYNRYLITMDIKNAYPSVSASRILENVRGSLLKSLWIRFPTLEQADKEELMRYCVFLTCFNNELPQGVNTSDKIINIVFAKADQKIQSYLEKQKFFLNAQYTRYKDDIAISYAANDTIYPLMQMFKDTKWKVDTLFESWEHLYEYEEILNRRKEKQPKKRWRKARADSYPKQIARDKQLERSRYTTEYQRVFDLALRWKKDPKEFASHWLVKDFVEEFWDKIKEELKEIWGDFWYKKRKYMADIFELVKHIMLTTTSLSNQQEAKMYHGYIRSIRERLERMRDRHIFQTEKGELDYDAMYHEIYDVIWLIDAVDMQSYIKRSGHDLNYLENKVLAILASEWRFVNNEKTNKRTPWSSNPREITWVAFNERWERILPPKKRNEYIKIFRLAITAPVLEKDWLEKSWMYREFIINWRVDVEHIKSKIQWIWWRILNVYGSRNPPKDLQWYYDNARQRRWDQGWLFHSLEEDSPYLPETSTNSQAEFLKKLDETRFNEAPIALSDMNDFPFPTIEDDIYSSHTEDDGIEDGDFPL